MSPVALVGNRNPGRRLSSTMMVHGGHWGAPSVMAAFAGFVHDRESTANDERNDDNDCYYGSVHCNLPAVKPTHAQLTEAIRQPRVDRPHGALRLSPMPRLFAPRLPCPLVASSSARPKHDSVLRVACTRLACAS